MNKTSQEKTLNKNISKIEKKYVFMKYSIKEKNKKESLLKNKNSLSSQASVEL